MAEWGTEMPPTVVYDPELVAKVEAVLAKFPPGGWREMPKEEAYPLIRELHVLIYDQGWDADLDWRIGGVLGSQGDNTYLMDAYWAYQVMVGTWPNR